MRMIDEIYTRSPFYGSRRITAQLNRDHNEEWNRKRIQRLMRIMGIRGVAPGPDTSRPHPENKIYPYLLRDMAIDKVNQVWSTDITYIPMARGFMYLVAVIDWYSRYVLSWELSNTMDTTFCIDALEKALGRRATARLMIDFWTPCHKNRFASRRIICALVRPASTSTTQQTLLR